MNKPELITALCTCPDEATAAKLSRGLVGERLAACVNIVPAVRSIYRWKTEICDEGEVLMVIKSTRSRFDALQTWLLEHHPYDVPEVVALDVSKVADEYRAWVESSMGPEG